MQFPIIDDKFVDEKDIDPERGYGSCVERGFNPANVGDRQEERTSLLNYQPSEDSDCMGSSSSGSSIEKTKNTKKSCITSQQSAEPYRAGIGIKMVALVLNCLSGSVYCMMRRYSQGILKEKYNVSEVLVVAEIFQVIITLGAVLQGRKRQEQSHSVYYLIYSSKNVLFISTIYAFCHIAAYIALRHLSAGVTTTVRLTKIFTVAFFSMILLGKRYSARKWGAMVILILGVVWYSELELTASHHLTHDTIKESSNVLIGFAAIFANVILSSLGSVYMEKYMKSESSKLSVWEINFQIAFVSIFIFIAIVASENKRPIGAGWSWMVVLLAFTAAVNGLMISLAIFYCSSTLKCLSSCVGVVLNSVLGHFLFGEPLTIPMFFSSLVVFFGLYLYTSDKAPQSVKENNMIEGTTILSENSEEDQDSPMSYNPTATYEKLRDPMVDSSRLAVL